MAATSSTPLNFAPYSEPPDAPSQTRWQPPPATSSYQSGAPVDSLGAGTSFGSSAAGGYAPLSTGAVHGAGSSSGYEVTLWRHDYEAVGAYALGPFGAAALLIFEIESDFVRFHAFQSILLNFALFLLQLLFLLLFGRWAQYLLYMIDIAVLALLSLRAYYDADHLERYHLPLVGNLANDWVQSE
ncbi:uncharacterized protein JCM10292_000086 [Rhodotorula paludigena]|uniref:uncharacterized protein n=1 Tax=Rhodotorula paludigena TaxID=86838 RepID=UPI003181E209